VALKLGYSYVVGVTRVASRPAESEHPGRAEHNIQVLIRIQQLTSLPGQYGAQKVKASPFIKFVKFRTFKLYILKN
jgi:hypothetical protein